MQVGDFGDTNVRQRQFASDQVQSITMRTHMWMAEATRLRAVPA